MDRFGDKYSPCRWVRACCGFLLLIPVLVILVFVPAAEARQRTAAPPASDNPASSEVPRVLADALAARLSQFADVISSQPGPVDAEAFESAYRASRSILTEAIKLLPADADLRRRRIGFAEVLGELELVRSDRRVLLTLDPADYLNQWWVSADRISELQTAEERFEAFGRFLGSAGAGIHATVRSRLACASGLLANELGDRELFAAGLKRALDLDPTQLEAIVFRLGMLGEQPSTTTQQEAAKLLVQWSQAEPTDPTAALALGNLLRGEGAYASARFALEQLEVLAGLRRELLDDESAGVLALTIAAEMGPLRGYEYLENYAQQRTQFEQAEWLRAWLNYETAVRAAAANEGTPQFKIEIPKPTLPLEAVASHQATLPRELTTLRLALAQLAALDEALIRAEVTTLAAQFRHAEDAWRALEPDPDSAAVARQRRHELGAERLWLRLWLTPQPSRHDEIFGSSVEAELSELVEHQGLRATAEQRFEGWINLHQGRLERARQLLEPQSAVDWPSALGLAKISALQAPAETAARRYTALWQATPGSLIGIWAGHRAIELRGRPLPQSALAHRLAEIVAAELNAVRQLLLRPEDQLRLQFQPTALTEAAAGSASAIPIRLRITNNTEFALAVGPGFFLGSRVIFEFSLPAPGEAAGDDFNSSPEAPAPTWTLLPGKRLIRALKIFALAPQAETELVVYLERSAIGLILRDLTPTELTVAVRARLAAHPPLGSDANFSTAPRPRALDYSTVTTFTLAPLLPPRLTNPFVPDFEDGKPFVEVINYLRSVIIHERGPDSAALRTALANLTQAWPALSDEARAFVLLTLPASAKSSASGLLMIFEEQVQESLGELATLAWILTRVGTFEDPHWLRALDSERPSHRAAANFIRTLGELPDG